MLIVMEEQPLFSAPESEDDGDEEEENIKKAPSLAELFSKDKKRSSKDIGQSIFGINLEDKDQQEGKNKEQSEQSLESPAENIDGHLTKEEEDYVNRTIAEDHLEHPVVEDEPLPLVTDFLDRVVEGEKPDNAYKTTLRDNRLEGVEVSDQQVVREYSPDDVRREIEGDQQAQAEDRELVASPRSEENLTRATTAYRENVRSVSPPTVRPNSNNRETRPSAQTSFLAGELAGYVLGHRRGSKTSKEKVAQERKKFEQKVTEMEAKLTKQEETIQLLSQEKRVRDRTTSPLERMQPGRRESRIGLSKPEKAGHIGKVLINKEKTAKPIDRERQRMRSMRPEEARTMRREDLIKLSSKINVEGASLKNMFENNLFGEGALRRLVEAYLGGKELMPILKREILEKQIDYERDPLFRDRGSQRERETSSSLFDRILDHTSVGTEAKNQSETTTNQIDKITSQSKQKQQPGSSKELSKRFSIIGAAITVTIVVLIGLIIYLIAN